MALTAKQRPYLQKNADRGGQRSDLFQYIFSDVHDRLAVKMMQMVEVAAENHGHMIGRGITMSTAKAVLNDAFNGSQF
jgi:hypothetical protein